MPGGAARVPPAALRRRSCRDLASRNIRLRAVLGDGVSTISQKSTGPRKTRAAFVLAGAASLALAFGAVGASASAQAGDSLLPSTPTTTSPVAGAASATLEECVTAVSQAERSVTFSGEMTALPGTVRMAMRVDIEERTPGEGEYHPISAPGLGVWRMADPKVKVYKYLKQVSNLSAPAAYRGLVHFRWIGAKGRPIKRAERLTGKCLQPAAPTETNEAAPPSSSGSKQSAPAG